jgi:nitrite reductase/ring-hydroxylating ferredoxin subunit
MSSTLVEYHLGPANDLPIGEGRAYAAGDGMVAVFRLRDGSLRAVSAICPHAGGPIADGITDSEIVICPLHQHVFELSTGCSRTGQPPLQTFPVRIDQGELVVGLPVTANSAATTTPAKATSQREWDA